MILASSEKNTLLVVARKAIESELERREFLIDSNSFEITEALRTNAGGFVTLKENGRLRGCVGFVEGIGTLFETIAEAAVSAACRDSRFPPVSLSELASIHIEISVLTPMKNVISASEIEIGRHGLFIRSGFRHGLLLPQVATEHGWDRTTFLEQTCIKAGISRNAWKQGGCEIKLFSACIFGDADE